jgi:hypothetical protein
MLETQQKALIVLWTEWAHPTHSKPMGWAVIPFGGNRFYQGMFQNVTSCVLIVQLGGSRFI